MLDSLGKMYNKDAILEFLLDRSSVGDGESICGHVRSMKVRRRDPATLETLSSGHAETVADWPLLCTPSQDLVTLNLTPNPKLAAEAGRADATTDTQAPTPLFVCPLTQREANGLIPFVAIRTSGDVFSEAGLKAVTKEAGSGGLPSPPPEDGGAAPDKDKAASARIALSPSSGKPFNPTFQGAKSTEDMTPAEGAVVAQKALASDLIYINPPQSLQDDLRIAIALNQAEAKASKKGKKRKSTAAGDDEPAKKAKAVVPARAPVVVEQSRAQVLAKAVSKDLKEAEDQRKRAGLSAAVQSLYKKEGEKEDENYMTRGTFTRVRPCSPPRCCPRFAGLTRKPSFAFSSSPDPSNLAAFYRPRPRPAAPLLGSAPRHRPRPPVVPPRLA